MKILKYRSQNTKICGTINVDTSRYKEIKNLAHLIMSNSHLDKDQYFILFDQHQEKLIEKIRDNSEIKISVYRTHFIYFHFPYQMSQIRINSCFETTFKEVNDIFKKNHFYLSFDFIKNMKMVCNGNELNNDGKPFHGLKDNDHVKIECRTKIVNLYYGYKKFFFCENELASVPKNFIRSQYKGCETVEIKDTNQKKFLNYNDRLKSNAQYKIKVPFKIIFRNKSNGTPAAQMLDFLATNNKAQKKIAKLYSTQFFRISPEDVILYDADRQPIKDSPISPIIAHNPRHEFYFEIKDGARNSFPNMHSQSSQKEYQNQHDQKYQDNYIHNTGNKLYQDDKKYANYVYNSGNKLHQDDKGYANYVYNSGNKLHQDDKGYANYVCNSGNKLHQDDKGCANYVYNSGNKLHQDDKKYANYVCNSGNKLSVIDQLFYNSTKDESENQDNKYKKFRQTTEVYRPAIKQINKIVIGKEGNEFDEEEETSLKILFIVKKIGEEGSNLLKRTLPLETTISDINEIICAKYEIEKDTLIDIKYKQKEGETTVSRDMTIEDIKHKMRNEQNKDYSYTLYVYINQPTSKNTKKAIFIPSDDDDKFDFKKPSKQKADPIRRNKNEGSDEDDKSIKNQRNQGNQGNKNERQNKKRKHHESIEDNENCGDNHDDDYDKGSYEDKKRPQTCKPKNQNKKARLIKSSDGNDDDENSEDKKRPQTCKHKKRFLKPKIIKINDDGDYESSEDKQRSQTSNTRNQHDKLKLTKRSDGNDDDENSKDKKRPQSSRPKRCLKPKIKKINDDDYNEKSKDKKVPQTSSPKNQNKKSKSEKSRKDDANSENDHKRLQSGRPKIQNNDDDNDEDDSKFDSPRK